MANIIMHLQGVLYYTAEGDKPLDTLCGREIERDGKSLAFTDVEADVTCRNCLEHIDRCRDSDGDCEGCAVCEADDPPSRACRTCGSPTAADGLCECAYW